MADKMSILYKGPSIDASYQVSVHLAEGFQRRRLKCEKLTDDGRQVMAKAHIAFGILNIKTNNNNFNPLKLLGQMSRNLVGSIYGRFSIKSAHFVPIR
jgi:hypothetical protein